MLVDLCSCSSDWYGLGFAVILLDFLGGSDGEASAYNVRNLGSIPGLGRSPGEGNGNPLHCSSLEIPWTEEPGAVHGLQRVRDN